MSLIGLIQGSILRRAPRFIRNKNLGRLLEVAALQIDGALDQLQGGLRQSNPFLCDPEALPIISKDRALPIYASEPDASKRFRLSRWWQLHRERGSHRGEINHTRPYFLGTSGTSTIPVFWIVFQDGNGASATWIKCDASGKFTKHVQTPSNFEYDGQTARCDRFFVFIELRAAGYSLPNTYNDGHTWDDGAVYDAGSTTTLTSAMAQDIVQMFLDWHAADTWCAGVAVVWKSGGLDVTDAGTQDASGWWSLPGGSGAGTWATPISRPPYISFLYVDP
jgi:hypothetical protein